MLLAAAAPALGADLPAPVLQGPDGSPIEVLNLRFLDGKKSVYLDITTTIESAGPVREWSLLLLDLEAEEIVWSKEGKGKPPNKVEWSGRLDTGIYPPADSRLGVRLVLQTTSGAVRSEALEFTVIDDSDIWHQLDRGLHLTPRGSVGVSDLTVTNIDGVEQKFVLWPVVITDLDFHINRRHHFGLRFESSSRLLEEGTGASVTYGTVHYGFAFLSPGKTGGAVLSANLMGFFYKAASIFHPDNDPDGPVQTFHLAFAGPAASVTFGYDFGEGFGFDLQALYGKGIDKTPSSIVTGTLGLYTPLTANILLGLALGQSKIEADRALEDEQGEKTDETATEKATASFARLVLGVAI